MKKILYITFAIASLISCQKVIDVDLNDANRNIVIEANYSAEDSTVRVMVTYTSSYFTTENSPAVDDAIVTITDHLGTPTPITSIGGGMYELTNYIPNYNTTYNMNVTHDGASYTAECNLFPAVPLLPQTYELIPGFFGQDGGYVVYMNFNDPAGIENHYVAVLTRNGDSFDKINQMFTQDDKLTDGNIVERPLFGQEFFELGDVIEMELRAIDEDMYSYINEAASIAGSGQASGAPGNPISNWDNKALGYFNCYSSSRDTVTIQ